MISKEDAFSSFRPSGTGNVEEKCPPLEWAAVPKESQVSVRESKGVKVIIRVVAGNEPQIHGRISGVHKRWKMSTNERCACSSGDESLNDERGPGSLGFSW